MNFIKCQLIASVQYAFFWLSYLFCMPVKLKAGQAVAKKDFKDRTFNLAEQFYTVKTSNKSQINPKRYCTLSSTAMSTRSTPLKVRFDSKTTENVRTLLLLCSKKIEIEQNCLLHFLICTNRFLLKSIITILSNLCYQSVVSPLSFYTLSRKIKNNKINLSRSESN